MSLVSADGHLLQSHVLVSTYRKTYMASSHKTEYVLIWLIMEQIIVGVLYVTANVISNFCDTTYDAIILTKKFLKITLNYIT